MKIVIKVRSRDIFLLVSTEGGVTFDLRAPDYLPRG